MSQQLNTYTFVNEAGQTVTLRLTEDDAAARGICEYRDGDVTVHEAPAAANPLAADLEASAARIADLEAQLAAIYAAEHDTDQGDDENGAAVTDENQQGDDQNAHAPAEEKQAPAPANKARQPRTPRQPRTKA